MYCDDVFENLSSGYIEYSVKNPSVYYETGRKVLDYQQHRIGVLSCRKKEINGSITLSYKINSYKSLREYSQTADYNTWDALLFKIFGIFSKIEENGFLKTGNIDLSPDKVFINVSDESVKVICLPLYKLCKYPTVHDEWENVRRTMLECSSALTVTEKNSLLRQINKRFGMDEECGLIDEKTELRMDPNVITEVLIDEKRSVNLLKDLFRKKQNNGNGETELKTKKIRKQKQVILRPLMGGDVIEITKPMFYIGSNSDMQPDAVISDNSTVSDIHCKVLIDKKKQYIFDCGSQYGTYINDMRLEEHTMTEFHWTDIIMIDEVKYSVD